jgi:C-terminal processing protease CtpA/Prc
LRARDGERLLRHLAFFRSELKLPAKDEVVVTVTDGQGGAKRDLKRKLSAKRPAFGTWPKDSPPRLPKPEVGYLRIAEMSDEPADLERVRASLKAFADAKALIVDVRGNGGGSRALVDVLVPSFMDAAAPPKVVNVARLRLRDGDESGAARALEDRGLFASGAPKWSEAERAVVVAAERSFKPSWTAPGPGWSALHWRTVSPADGATAPRFTGKVAVLLDGGCFSATDILLGALKGLPRVTLIGTPSGGGSGRARGYALPRTGVKLQYSTMVSYRPDGRLYDGLGIEPDVVVECVATDLIGKSDAVLDAALKHLSR